MIKTRITELLGIERPIVQGGMQGVGLAELASAVLAVPLSSGAGVRLSALEPGTVLPSARAVVQREGWHMELRWPLEALPKGDALRLGLAVNERPPERERRRGQLVLGGAAGFAYLRGDRLDAAESWTLKLP